MFSTMLISHLLTGAEVDMEVEAAAAVDHGHRQAAEAGQDQFIPRSDPLKFVQTL